MQAAIPRFMRSCGFFYYLYGKIGEGTYQRKQ